VSWLARVTHEGACNEPVPGNWSDACLRREGHKGEHRGSRLHHGRELAWSAPNGPVTDRRVMSRRVYAPGQAPDLRWYRGANR